MPCFILGSSRDQPADLVARRCSRPDCGTNPEPANSNQGPLQDGNQEPERVEAPLPSCHLLLIGGSTGEAAIEAWQVHSLYSLQYVACTLPRTVLHIHLQMALVARLGAALAPVWSSAAMSVGALPCSFLFRAKRFRSLFFRFSVFFLLCSGCFLFLPMTSIISLPHRAT